MEVWRIFCRFVNLTLGRGGGCRERFLVLSCQEERVFTCRVQAACHHGTEAPALLDRGLE